MLLMIYPELFFSACGPETSLTLDVKKSFNFFHLVLRQTQGRAPLLFSWPRLLLF